MTDAYFQQTVWNYYSQHSRSMPWRDNTSPYYVLVSEMMLQQTQVDRVIPKFLEFIQQFQDVHALANASFGEVLRTWSGLGYNRRARYLHTSAQRICSEHKAIIPDTIEALIGLPGIGNGTARAILAYAYNKPVVFIETNIRAV